MNDSYGSVMRESLKRSMSIPARQAHYWPAKASFWERHGLKILWAAMFVILWICLHLWAVGL